MQCKNGISKTAKKLIRYVPELADVIAGDSTITDFVLDAAEDVIDSRELDKRRQKARRALSMRDMIKTERKKRKKEIIVDQKHEVDILNGVLYFDAYLGVFRIHASYPPVWIKKRHVILAPTIAINSHAGNSQYRITYSDDGTSRNEIIVDFKTQVIVSYSDNHPKPILFPENSNPPQKMPQIPSKTATPPEPESD